eukprot:scaffold58920_cov36-Phaeocystis_antarctica.AAC.2
MAAVLTGRACSRSWDTGPQVLQAVIAKSNEVWPPGYVGVAARAGALREHRPRLDEGAQCLDRNGVSCGIPHGSTASRQPHNLFSMICNRSLGGGARKCHARFQR